MTFRRMVAAAATVVIASATTAPGQSALAGQKIVPQSFGMHSFAQQPGVPVGSIRMNMWPTWRQLEPTRGNYNWAIMDSTLAMVDSWGITDRLFVFGGTPEWAGAAVKNPEKEYPANSGLTAPPKDMSYWRDFVNAFVKRYAADLDSYEAWNEITTLQFWQGSAKQMATMTKILNQAVDKYDGSAKVVSGSVQTHTASYYEPLGPPYFKQLQRMGWPIDVVAGHFYPYLKGGPDKRIAQIEMLQKDLKKYMKPSRVEVWDTEANFWTGVPGTPPDGRVRGKKAATWVARNYLDTWRTGLKRSYWYMWTVGTQDLSFPGIQMRSDTPWSKVAYTNLYDWTVGTKFTGCTTKGKLVTCTFKKGGSFQIAFTTKGTATAKFSGSKSVTPVYGGGTVTAKGSTKVGTMPVRIG